MRVLCAFQSDARNIEHRTPNIQWLKVISRIWKETRESNVYSVVAIRLFIIKLCIILNCLVSMFKDMRSPQSNTTSDYTQKCNSNTCEQYNRNNVLFSIGMDMISNIPFRKRNSLSHLANKNFCPNSIWSCVSHI